MREVVYVDNDPAAIAHSHALPENNTYAAAIRADLRAPEAAPALRPGGRFGISDVLAELGVDPARRAEAEHAVGCPVGTPTAADDRDQPSAAGFATTAIIPTHTLAGGLYSAIVQATTPRPDDDAPRSI